MPEDRRNKRKKAEKVLRPEYVKALEQSMKEFDALLKRLAEL
jgi:hypothetical protein